MKTLSTLRLLVFAGMLFAFFSCTKNNAVNEPRLALPDAGSFQDLRNEALKDLVQTKTFKAEDGVEFTSAKGVKLQIWGDCLQDQEGNAVTGDVTLSFVEMYDRGNMLVTNKPLMGINANGKKEPLVTGGQFNIEVKQGNKILKPGCLFSMQVPAGLTGGLDHDMSLWTGSFNENGDLAWEEVQEGNGKERPLNPNEQQTSYGIFGQEFGWNNVDRFSSYTGPKTQIKVTVPAAYNQTNSGVFLAYEDSPYTLAQLDSYDTAEKYFTEHYGFVPVGLTVHVIFTSESNGQIVYAIKQVTITSGSIIAINESDLNTTTKENLVSMINALH